MYVSIYLFIYLESAGIGILQGSSTVPPTTPITVSSGTEIEKNKGIFSTIMVSTSLADLLVNSDMLELSGRYQTWNADFCVS